MLLIPTYHSITVSDWSVAVTSQKFQQQLAYLKGRGFSFVKASELRAIAESRSHRGKKIACITFDDGLRDNYTTAFPILKGLGIPASIFVSPGLVGTGRESNSVKGFLTWDEMREMQESGLVEIHNHTYTHVDLRNLASAQMDEEIRRTNDEIEQNLGVRPRVIAYPKGRYDARVQEAAARWCEGGLGSVGITTESSTVDLYALPRVPVHRHIKLWKFALRTHPFFWRLQKAFGRV